eukprot:TRINITY_DN17103_c0_g1_i2.p1 TRINITY_DN17103_c0_g1~~TRINITY_DN17103_c0_g1_i2.p1  ORF type:complete len:634 (+),score=78.20 TRINITY_DN17103_c0_g1_i2:98-1999(+)
MFVLYLAVCLQVAWSVRIGDDGVADYLLHEDGLANLSIFAESSDDADEAHIYASGPGECTEIQIIRDTTFYYPTRGIYVPVGELNGEPLYRSQDKKYYLWYDNSTDEDGGPGWAAGEQNAKDIQNGFDGSWGYTIKCYGYYPAAHLDEFDWKTDCKGMSFGGSFKHEKNIEFRCLQRNPIEEETPCDEYSTKVGCEMPIRNSKLMMRLGKRDTPEARCWWGFGPDEDASNPVERCHRRACQEILVERNGVSQQVKTGTYKLAFDDAGKPITHDGRPVFVGRMYSVFYSDRACYEQEKKVKPAERFIFKHGGMCEGWHVGELYDGKMSSGISCYDNVQEPSDANPATCRTKSGLLGGWHKDYTVRIFCIKRDQSDQELGFVDKALLRWSQPGGALQGVVRLVGRASTAAWEAMKDWVRSGYQAAKTCFSFSPVEHRGLACWSFVKKVATVAFAVASIACMLSPCAVVGVGAIGAVGIAAVAWAIIRTGVDTVIQRKGKSAGDQGWSWYAVMAKVGGTALQIVGAAVGAPDVVGETLDIVGQAVSAIGIDPMELVGRDYDPASTEGRLSRLMKECQLASEASHQKFQYVFIDPENEYLKKAVEKEDFVAANKDSEGNLHPSCADVRRAFNIRFGS